MLSLLASLAVIVSSALAYISYCVICSLCIMCSLSYVVNLFIVILLFRIAVVSRFSLRQGVLELLASMRCHFKAAAVASMLFALVVLSFPAYWKKVGGTWASISMTNTTGDAYAASSTIPCSF